jgi:hypothetical protein
VTTLFLLLNLINGLAALVAPQVQPVPQPEFRFAWPVGIAVRVDSERSRERTGSGAAQPTQPATKSSQTMRVLAHPEGRVIRFDLAESSSEAARATALGWQPGEALLGLLPSFVVSEQGRLIRLENLQAYQKTLSDRAAKVDGTQELVARVTSEEALTALVGQEWELLVGSWLELPVKPAKYDLENEQPTPFFPGLKVPMKITVEVNDPAPCSRGGAQRSCSNLAMTSRVDQAGLRPLFDKLTQGMPDLQSVRVERLDVVTIVRVKLETETMLPHDVSWERTMEMTMVDGKLRSDAKQVDRGTSRFTYPDR